MRIVVTGAAGFIGSHLCEQLIAEGHHVVGLDAFVPYYPREIKERNLAGLHQSERFSFHEIDLRYDDLNQCLIGADVVINEAAMPGLRKSWTQFDEYLSCNLLAVARLVEACRQAQVHKLIHISTSSVYGRYAVGDENQPTKPLSPYGVTKLAAEHLVLAHAEAYGIQATILRYFSIFGPRQRPDMAYNIFTERMLRGEPITVFGDGNQSRSNTYVADCVRGTILAIDGGEPGQIYNIGGGEIITVNAAIEIIADTIGTTPVIQHEPAIPGDQRETAADTSKAYETFGYQPQVSPEDGLRAQVEWQRSQFNQPNQR